MSTVALGEAASPTIRFRMERQEIIRAPSYHQVSNLGVVQFKHEYDEDILARILKRALELKDMNAEKRHLNLKYIRGAHRYIPEIRELVESRGRLERLSHLAGTRLENYPLSIISTIVTFMGADEDDGSIVWHADGIPVTELVPLDVADLEGGELELYRGSADAGLALQAGGESPTDTLCVDHRLGYSVLGQLMRIMHRVRPITRGYRITLNMNLRSFERPFIDDNSMCYLAADNPDFSWQNEYLRDLKERVLPAYLGHTQRC
jgi:hypothetical protein